jgi:predicted nucleic acid-binding protein
MRRIVVDASVLVASLMADGRARHALLHTPSTLYVPPRVFEELERKAGKIAARARLDRTVVEALMADIRQRIEVVPEALLAPFLPEARARAQEADAEGDEDYVAASLALDAPIWTYDRDFRRIRGIRVIGTAEVSGES